MEELEAIRNFPTSQLSDYWTYYKILTFIRNLNIIFYTFFFYCFTLNVRIFLKSWVDTQEGVEILCTCSSIVLGQALIKFVLGLILNGKQIYIDYHEGT